MRMIASSSQTIPTKQQMAKLGQLCFVGVLCLSLNGCIFNTRPEGKVDKGGRYEIEQDGPDPSSNRNPAHAKNAVPKWEPKSKYGNPPSYEVFGKRYYVLNSSEGYQQRGIASWYGKKFHGKRTSSGEPYDMYGMTAAHKSLPLPTYVKVTNLKNAKHVILRVNDRGPFHDNRLIDLSYSAAYQLGIVAKGTGLVEVEAINPSRWQAQQQTQTQTPATSSSHPAAPKPIPDSNPIQPKIYVQVGAFASKLNAQKLLKQLNSSYPTQVFIDQKMVNGKRFSRVRIGPVSSVERADQMALQLLNQGHNATRIVVE